MMSVADIATVAALRKVDENTTVDKLEALNAAADQAYDQMVTAWKDLDQAQRDAIEGAVDEYRATVNTVSGE